MTWWQSDPVAPAAMPVKGAADILALARSRPQAYQPSPEEATQMAEDVNAVAARRAASPPSAGEWWAKDKLAPYPDEREIDMKTGAPAVVRNAVGGAPTQDRLSTLQRYYPDARAHGDDNFVFTDPKTKRATLYNPKGFDFGDVSSVTPEIAEFGGGLVGGALAAPPALAAAPFTGGASLLTVPAAIGLGAAGGREVENLLAKATSRRQDTRSLPQRLTDSAVTAGSNAVGARVGELVTQGAARIYGPVARMGARALGGTAQALRDFANARVTPSAGAVTQNRAVQQLEKGLANTPGGAAQMQRQAETQVAEIRAAADDIARRYATANGANPAGIPRTAQGAGEALQASARRAGQRFADRREILDDAVEAAIGTNTPAIAIRSNQLLTELQAQLARAPESLAPGLNPAIERLQALAADAAANGGHVPFGALRQIRTMVGRLLDRPDISGYSPAAEAAMRRVYGALAQDIRETAEATGRDALAALNRHDRYVRFARGERLGGEPGPLARLQKLQDAGTPEQAFKYAMALAKEGGSRLYSLRRSMPPEDWDVVAGSVLSRLGRAKPGSQGFAEVGEEAGDFSVASFLTNFRAVSPEAQRALFNGTRYADLTPELNRLARIVARLKDAESMANFSGTARALGVIGALYGAGEGAVGDWKRGLGAGVGLILAPHVTARLITNPRFVAWLADSGGQAMSNPQTFAAHLARLGTIATIEPRIRDEIGQYIAALRGVPPEAPAPAKEAQSK